MTTTAVPQINEEKLFEFVFKMVGDMGATANAPLVLLGDQLGLYKAIADGGDVTSESLAKATGTKERYVREWLATQAAAGYIEYNADANTFSITPEKAMALANDESPVFMMGAFYSFVSLFADQAKLAEAFKSGSGVAWGDHHDCLFSGVAKFFKPSYRAHLVQDWIPALGGDTKSKLERGAKVADVGCGHGVSTVLMAKAFPNSTFVGYDIHAPSIEEARRGAEEAGVTNVSFEVSTAQAFPGAGYDLVTFFDCLHDMGDPLGAATQVKKNLAEDGTWMIVEPMAKNALKDNLNPVGQLYYAYSTQVCTPSAMSQDGGTSLGAQAGEERLTEILQNGGFGQVRRASETPFNMVLEARA